MAIPHRQAKVISYRLIEENSQTLNEGLFLPYCKVFNVFEKNVTFSLLLQYDPKQNDKHPNGKQD